MLKLDAKVHGFTVARYVQEALEAAMLRDPALVPIVPAAIAVAICKIAADLVFIAAIVMVPISSPGIRRNPERGTASCFQTDDSVSHSTSPACIR